jgi:RNA polymerase sigma factor (sigma-70 family)
MRDKTDLEPLWRVHWGSTEATSELFRRHYPAMVRYAKTLTNDPTMADDLASEAFTRTLERVRIGAVPQTLRAYLTTAVRNGAVDEFRRTNPLSSLTTHDEDRGSVASTSAPLDFTSGLVDRDQLRQALFRTQPPAPPRAVAHHRGRQRSGRRRHRAGYQRERGRSPGPPSPRGFSPCLRRCRAGRGNPLAGRVYPSRIPRRPRRGRGWP